MESLNKINEIIHELILALIPNITFPLEKNAKSGGIDQIFHPIDVPKGAEMLEAFF